MAVQAASEDAAQHPAMPALPLPAEAQQGSPGAQPRSPSAAAPRHGGAAAAARKPGAGSASPSTPTGRAAPAGFPYHQGTSQFKGVSWSERSRKWRAQLWFGSKVRRPVTRGDVPHQGLHTHKQGF